MISFREEFIKRYLKTLCHKVEQELNEKLPETGIHAGMVEQADEVMRELFKRS